METASNFGSKKFKIKIMSVNLFLKKRVLFNNMPSLNPWGHYQFKELSGFLAYTKNNDKPLTSNVSTMWNANGKINRCIQSLPGDNLAMSVLDGNAILNNNEFSFAFWYNQTIENLDHYFIEKGNASGTRVFRFSIESGQYRILVGNNVGAWKYTAFTGIEQPPLNTWVHLAITVSTSQYLFYKDGVLIHEVNFADTTYVQENTEPLYVGGRLVGVYGKMDELYIFDRKLTASEVMEIKNYTS